MGSLSGHPPAGSRHNLMDGLVHEAGPSHGRVARLFERLLGRRRQFVVDPSYQLRSAIIAVLGMCFLLMFAAALLHLLSVENARLLVDRVPIAKGAVDAHDLRSVLYLVGVGLFFVAAVFAIEIFETHKTAGVVNKVTRGLRDVESGRWGARVTLRKHDNFKEMEEAFNAATRALRGHLDQDLHGLQGIESQIRLIAREFESNNREGALVLLRQVASEMQSFRERKRNLLEQAPDTPRWQNRG
ncbi:MAG TPA: hypothetical protein VGV60_17980 [Candidatus Polarisedimenticolia bacterium]|nr:hypothetical protein [Candidatus Polarisedimenticolia bacterium]